MKKIIIAKNCLICNNNKLVKYLDLGKSALANSYLEKKDLKKREDRFPLRVYYCPRCHLAQLIDIVNRKLLFKNYAYFSSTSPQLEAHFEQYATEVVSKFPEKAKKLTVEIASNDGILLKHFKNLGANILGVDPAVNIANVAQKNGIETLPIFFTSAAAKKILKKYGAAGIVTANNVLAHTDILHDIVEGVSLLLKKDGVFVFEVQYLGDLIQKNEFDNTYHEHICYFSLAPLITLLAKHNLRVFDVKHVATQGGSLRVYAAHTDSVFPLNASVSTLLKKEKQQRLYHLSTYKNFSKAPIKIKQALVSLLKKLKGQNKKIVGYGAPAKGNTLLQYCNIGKNYIDYIVDNAPSKQGKYTPGSHIPIFAPEKLKEKIPDYVLILAWNYTDSIMKNESWLKERGVKFIQPVPNVKII